MDRTKMATGIRTFLEGVGHGFEGDDQARTPERVAKAWIEDLIAGYDLDADAELTWTPAPRDPGVVVVRGVRFASVCVHHLLPFFGVAHVAYLPGERLAGLSKIGRVVDVHSRRLQTQEHLTAEIVATLERVLRPAGVLAILEAEHTCMTLRGVRKEGSRMVTLSSSGVYDTDPAARSLVVDLIHRAGG
jgi:GTP cyclohydrolase I